MITHPLYSFQKAWWVFAAIAVFWPIPMYSNDFDVFEVHLELFLAWHARLCIAARDSETSVFAVMSQPKVDCAKIETTHIVTWCMLTVTRSRWGFCLLLAHQLCGNSAWIPQCNTTPTALIVLLIILLAWTALLLHCMGRLHNIWQWASQSAQHCGPVPPNRQAVYYRARRAVSFLVNCHPIECFSHPGVSAQHAGVRKVAQDTSKRFAWERSFQERCERTWGLRSHFGSFSYDALPVLQQCGSADYNPRRLIGEHVDDCFPMYSF